MVHSFSSKRKDKAVALKSSGFPRLSRFRYLSTHTTQVLTYTGVYIWAWPKDSLKTIICLTDWLIAARILHSYYSSGGNGRRGQIWALEQDQEWIILIACEITCTYSFSLSRLGSWWIRSLFKEHWLWTQVYMCDCYCNISWTTKYSSFLINYEIKMDFNVIKIQFYQILL